jgi:F0F1-type ATP synthase delta subunit
MKYLVKDYAKSLAELSLDSKNKKEEVMVHNFLSLLEKNRDISGVNKILDLAGSIYFKKSGKKKIVVEAARQLTAGNKKILKSIVREGDVAEERINPELLAGIKIVVNNEKQFDGSILNKIKKLFK